MDHTPETRLSPITKRVLFTLVALFFMALPSILVFQFAGTLWSVFQHRAETKGIIISKEYNSVHQFIFYEVRYTWKGKTFSTENISAIADHEKGDTLSIYLNQKNPSLAVIKEDKWLRAALGTGLIWLFCTTFGIFLIKLAFKNHE